MHESLSRPGVYWLAPLGNHLALEQDYVILKGRKRPEVMAFYTFVGSPEARRIFQRYGFLLPGEQHGPLLLDCPSPFLRGGPSRLLPP
ncbi:substrate-binding domain-containing protein, partial [Klebsiella pneumoniae]|uniref:substrate-binding domain-containing protein n=1 Tax=Klebsiella pneumoniae TaxID=573 RepID=UPI003B5C8909